MLQGTHKDDHHQGRKEEIQQRSLEEDVTPPTLSSKTPVYHITSHCLFWSEDIPASGKLTNKCTKLISDVETIEFKDNVLKCARERSDEWGKLVAKPCGC